jgi:hypothetical protein
VVFLVELAFVLGFIYSDLLCERNLSKKGCWVFPHLGFSQDNYIYIYIYVNGNEVKRTLATLMLCK